MSSLPAEKLIRLRVRRGRPGAESAVVDYAFPADAASSLLDGLRWIRANVDQTLAFRYSCINANACKECMMRLDGKVVYACMEKLAPDCTYDVEPLPNKSLVRDLVTEIAPAKERLTASSEPDDD